MSLKKNVILALALLIFPPFVAAGKKILVPIYVYHLKPPYIIEIENETGLYYDFSRYLSLKSEKYEFHTIYLPRKRIDIYLERNILDGILLGANPIWFQDKARKKYLWSPPVFFDQDEVVSLAATPFEYLGPESLINKSLGGVLGFYYLGIDPLVSQGKIIRNDARSEESVLKMILTKRVDVGIVSRSTFQYFSNREKWKDKFHLSRRPHDIFTRNILIPHKNKAIYNHITPLLNNLKDDHNWQRILKKHQ